jgi:hypothetical protein
MTFKINLTKNLSYLEINLINYSTIATFAASCNIRDYLLGVLFIPEDDGL